MKISLAINSKNPRPEWLKQCLDSAQDFDEIILYLDGVNTGDESIAREFGRKIIVVGDGKERSIVEGFNYAVSKTTGDWICSFCDDDYFITGNLQSLIRTISTGEYDNADVIYFRVSLSNCGEWGTSNVTIGEMLGQNQIPHGSFFRRSVHSELGGYQTECCTDWDFWLRALIKGYRFRYFPNPVYVFRTGHESAYKRHLKEYGGFEAMKRKVMENVRV